MDTLNNIKQYYHFGAFGNLEHAYGEINDNHYKFTGKEEDITELYYFGARYYDPEVGRFISPDPLQDEHPYAYCGSDPVNFVDLTGLQEVILSSSTWSSAFWVEGIGWAYLIESEPLPTPFHGIKNAVL